MAGPYRIDLRRWVQSPPWFWGFVASTVLCLLIYLLNTVLSEVNPGNWWGITYGTLASLLMAGAGAISIRRRSMNLAARRPLGRSSVWLQFHLYGGTLALVLVFMHSGFRIPTGSLNWWLWFLSIWVVISGLFGVALQKVIPRILSSALAVEVVYERIPELVGEISKDCKKLAEKCSEPVRLFYSKSLETVLASPEPKFIYCIDITGGIQSRIREFDFLRRVLSSDEREKLDQLESLVKTKFEIDAQYTLQRALRWWLYTHVPVSLLLLVMIGLHLYTVWYY